MSTKCPLYPCHKMVLRTRGFISFIQVYKDVPLKWVQFFSFQVQVHDWVVNVALKYINGWQIRQLLYKTGSLCRQITNIRKLVHIYQFRKSRKWVHKSTVHTLKYLKTFVHIIRNTKLENVMIYQRVIFLKARVTRVV
jgi:hypothetical protein